MKRYTILFLFIPLLASILLPACDNGFDDDYSTNPGHRLSFSKDTLSFDTVFTTIGSATRQFMIYNTNSKPLNMENIRLAGENNNGFYINVDGRKGTSFDNIRIEGKDSMYVFVEVKVDPNGSNQPLIVQDSILFSVHGIRQSVLLEAYGQDVHLHKNGLLITQDSIFKADRPYLIYDSLYIAEGAKVEIEEGAIFYMHDTASIVVHGSIQAHGSQEFPILFRGDRLDYILEETLPYDRSPAQWNGFIFHPESYDNTMDHVIIRNGKTGISCEAADPSVSKLKITNSQISNMDGTVLAAINCNIEVINTEMTNATVAIAALIGGEYRFIHSTLTNQMTLSPRRDSIPYEVNTQKKSHTLVLSNILPGRKETAPLTATFDNCIIDGNYSPGIKPLTGEILLNEQEGTTFDYRFNHCVIKTVKEDGNTNFNEVIFTKKNLAYRLLGGKDNKYAYDFHLANDTTAGVGKADPAITALYPVDRYGVNRLTSPHGPTIGAYEFVPEEKKEE
ncbi:hypothetical protein D0T51_09420 [Parabacteroides sp. 52]|uniref:hypothetical protein n=1 Tax=unclassified Parabacteroides TaxID=2649774 RepID=UPI0013D6E802|nr:MULTISPECIES: hypothetical protein [unclassified Parabacteroides]MDH6535476.1 3-phenylpropionate/cinnamic acid dioxygenase small subunit [Parabacteroides sp. PM5-20]NDV55944.1 hypothetical protein [Parabacteroides sp. 52]